MREQGGARDFDWWLLFLVLAISGIGVLSVYYATRATPVAGIHMRQLTWVGVGLVAMLVMSRIDYHKIIDQAPILYLVGLGMLVAVLLVGKSQYGTKGWLSIFGQRLQVAEVVKLVIIVVLARFFSEVRTDHLTLADIIKATGLIGVPVGLIILQPDLGTAIMYLPILGVGAFLTGIQWKHVVAGLVLVAVLMPVGWYLVKPRLKPYQQQRIETFLNPGEDLQGSGYQTKQAKIAAGSGGFWGKGFGKGTQSQLGYLPVAWSDFIFSSHAEETGFAGVFTALMLYMALLLRLVQNAQKAVDRTGMHLVMGVAAVLGIHLFWNVGMGIGYLPITGIPLPLMSYGGSAMLFVFLALGVVMNVRMRRFVN